MIAVDGGGYDTATEGYVKGNRLAATAYDTITGKLAACAAMAGDDSTSAGFASSYDDAAQQAVHALADVVAAFAGVGRVTHASVTNHREADARSVLGGSQVYAGGPLPAGGPVEVLPSSPPSSLGGDSPQVPAGVGWILDHVQGFAWPDADTTRLRRAGRAWRTAAESLDGVAIYCDAAVRALGEQRSPEIPLAVAATHDLRARVRDLAGHCVELAAACETFADQVDDTRERTLALAEWLLEQVVEGVLISVALGAITGGAGAGAGLAAVAGRVAAEAPRFLRLLDELRALAATAAAGLRTTRAALHATRLGLAKFTLAGVERGEAGMVRLGGGARGLLRAHETAGGHTLARHVGKTAAELRRRFRDQPWLRYASSFSDERTAESAIARALDRSRGQIKHWLETGVAPLDLESVTSKVVGTCMDRSGRIVDARKFVVVLVRDSSMPDGYRILTAYPEP